MTNEEVYFVLKNWDYVSVRSIWTSEYNIVIK